MTARKNVVVDSRASATHSDNRWVVTLVGIVFVLAVSYLAHLLFSSHGFNPSDEGYYLSNARRVLDGEVPHRDFITLRPAGAYLLFAPLVAWGGDSTIWISRFFALVELVTIAWLWALMIHRHLGAPFGHALPVAPALVAFMLMLGWYPLMVTTTVEGYFCFTIGLALVFGGAPARRMLGYLIMGYAYLCRQNMLFAGVLSVVALGDWRQLRYWVALALPGIVYVVWLASVGGLVDFFIQLTAASTRGTSHGGFFAIGVLHWLRQPLLYLGLLTGAAAGWLFRRSAASHSRRNVLQVGAGVAIVFAIAVAGPLMTLRYGHISRVPDFRWYSFAVAGLTASLLVSLRWRAASPPFDRRLVWCGLAIAWGVSFSWATAAPTLFIGPLVLFSLAITSIAVRHILTADHRGRLGWGLGVLAVPLAVILYEARQGWIGLDPPSSQMTQRVDGVFPGARHLVTDANTYAYLVDFQDALRRAGPSSVVIAPDLAAYWIRAPRRNPISINWPYTGELINAALENRVIRELEQRRGTYTFIGSKVMVITLPDGFISVPEDWSPVLDTIRNKFTKVGETRYFELYR